jgi:hypothetical protein
MIVAKEYVADALGDRYAVTELAQERKKIAIRSAADPNKLILTVEFAANP